MSLQALCRYDIYLAKGTFEKCFNGVGNALVLHYLKCLSFKKRKKAAFFPLILIHVQGHIVVPDAFHFLQQTWERCSLNLCAYKNYANFMDSVDELLKLYFAGIRKLVF